MSHFYQCINAGESSRIDLFVVVTLVRMHIASFQGLQQQDDQEGNNLKENERMIPRMIWTSLETRLTLAANTFNTGSGENVGDFVAISDFLINKIKQHPEGNDIPTALEKLEEFDFTSLKPT